MRKVFIFTLLLSFLLVACPNTSESRRPPPLNDTDYCLSAQQHLEELCQQNTEINKYCCKVVEPTKKQKDFKTFCKETMSKGINLNPKCISEVKKCEEIDVCTNSRKQ